MSYVKRKRKHIWKLLSRFRTLFNTINRRDIESKTHSIHMYGKPRESDMHKMELFFTEQQTDVTGRTSSEKFNVPGLKLQFHSFDRNAAITHAGFTIRTCFTVANRTATGSRKKLRSSWILPGSIRNETNWTTLYHVKPRFSWNRSRTTGKSRIGNKTQ